MAAEFVFEGEIESLSPRQQEFLCDVLKKRGFKGNKVQIESVGQAGDNYVASIKRITVHGKDGDTFKIIAKVAPTQEAMRAIMSAELLFKNEVYMYNNVLSKYDEMQRAADVPKEECLRYAECYGVLTEAPEEIVLLEDLQVFNFEILDRFESLTNDSVKLILKNFAILHALSYALKKEEPETFETFGADLYDYMATLNIPEFKDYLIDLQNDTLAILDSEKYKKPVRNLVSQMGILYSKIYKMDTKSRYSVIAQGDPWTNNVMFRLENKNVVEAIMIDYQLSRLSSPATDLLYMIFNCTDHSTRSNHYYDWMDYYHSELDKSLSNFGLKANYVYPRDQLDADLRRYCKIFFGNTIMLASMLIRKPEDVAIVMAGMENGMDPNAVKTSSLDSKSVELFKKRVEGLVDSYREFGYIE